MMVIRTLDWSWFLFWGFSLLCPSYSSKKKKEPHSVSATKRRNGDVAQWKPLGMKDVYFHRKQNIKDLSVTKPTCLDSTKSLVLRVRISTANDITVWLDVTRNLKAFFFPASTQQAHPVCTSPLKKSHKAENPAQTQNNGQKLNGDICSAGMKECVCVGGGSATAKVSKSLR